MNLSLLDHLQDIMFNCTFGTKENEDFAYLAIAGIKQVCCLYIL